MTLKKLLVAGATTLAALALVGGLSWYGMQKVSADETVTLPPLLQRIVEKFNLDESAVKEVVTTFRDERKADMEAKFTKRLDQAVTDGKITAEQKQLILDKKAEMETKRSELEGLTPSERRAEMEARRTELETWASENGIDLMYLGGFGPHHGGEMGPGMGRGMHRGFEMEME